MKFRRKSIRAFVLSGGGARGALQVGAIRALFEAGIWPDMLVGTSAGGVNAALLALNPSLDGVERLTEAWHHAAVADLLPTASLRVALRLLQARGNGKIDPALERFFLAHLADPNLRFGDITGPKLYLVATELNCGRPFLFGTDPDHRLLDGLLATTAIPPWIQPQSVGSSQCLDGGFVSNLAIEPALALGATEIFALEVKSPTQAGDRAGGLVSFLLQLANSTNQRIKVLEADLARSRNVPLHLITLQPHPPVQIWDFSHTDSLMETGYVVTRQYLLEHRLRADQASWSSLLKQRLGANGNRRGPNGPKPAKLSSAQSD